MTPTTIHTTPFELKMIILKYNENQFSQFRGSKTLYNRIKENLKAKIPLSRRAYR